ncbi:MAG: Crp/Fnr family transcriptional regulator [Bacteroidota bacterium]
MEELFQLLNGYHPLPVELQVVLMNQLPKEIHRANKPILDAGQVCEWLGFVEKGLLKIYYELEDGTEKVVWFLKEGDVIGSMKSFYKGTPSRLCIRTMEETTLRKIRKPDLYHLYQKFTEFNVNARLLTEEYYSRCEDHLILQIIPLEERIKVLEADHPWMLKDSRIKDYMIADYIGIHRSTLSRYRNGKKYRGREKS